MNTTNQLFTYMSNSPGSIIYVSYEAPAGVVKTVRLSCDAEQKAIIHRDVLHVKAIIEEIKKEDDIKKGT